jgi:hypothetical protein
MNMEKKPKTKEGVTKTDVMDKEARRRPERKEQEMGTEAEARKKLNLKQWMMKQEASSSIEDANFKVAILKPTAHTWSCLSGRREFYEILSCFGAHDIPLSILRRSVHRRHRWQSNGELVTDSLIVPNGLTFFANNTLTKTSKWVPVIKLVCTYISLGMRAHNIKGGEWFFSMPDDLRKVIMGSLSPEQLFMRQLDALTIILQAYPDEYSEVIWEELRLQMDKVLEATFIPLLRIITVKDVRRYIQQRQWQVIPLYLDYHLY